MELTIGKGNTWVKRRPGYVMPGHPDRGLAGRSWVGWLLGVVPLRLLGWASWLGVPGLGPWYPQCPPFLAGEEDHPLSEKKEQA